MANRRAVIAQAEIRRAARVAKAEGCRVTIELPSGLKFHVERDDERPLQPAKNPWED